MKISTIVASSLCMMACLPAAAQLPQSNVPAGYTNIQPAPGSTVDVSPNVFPLGVSNISFSYKGADLAINEANTTPALLYYNDFTTPAASTLRTSIDVMTMTSAAVIFTGTFNQNGEYKIEIPEGMFKVVSDYDADDRPIYGELLPAMTLYYEILVPWQAEPANASVVADLAEIRLVFDGATDVKEGSSFSSISFADRFTDEVEIRSSIEGNVVTFTLQSDGKDTPLSEPGQYLLHLPARAITYTLNGRNRSTDEIRLTYYVPYSPEPEVWPTPGETLEDGFEYFELTVPEGFDTDPDSFMGLTINDRASNYLYRVDDRGNVDTSTVIAVCKALLGECDRANRRIYLALFDPTTLEPLNFELDTHPNASGAPQSDLYSVVEGSLKPWEPAEGGKYCLVLSQSLYSGFYTSADGSMNYVTSDPYRYIFVIPGDSTAIGSVEAGEAGAQGAVWSIDGLKVADEASDVALKALPAGIYIVNGKKLIINGK